MARLRINGGPLSWHRRLNCSFYPNYQISQFGCPLQHHQLSQQRTFFTPSWKMDSKSRSEEKKSKMNGTSLSSAEPFPRFPASAPITDLLERNRAWAERQKVENPTMFPSLEHSQHPHILWIGCSDSRVPETTVLDLLPGDVFVHRNIANVVSAGDLSVLSVIQFAVEVLGVSHIVVCGKTTPYREH